MRSGIYGCTMQPYSTPARPKGAPMPQHDLSLVDGIRAASRQMVRELGFMQATLAATDYPPSAVHAILEIGTQGRMAASQLAQALDRKSTRLNSSHLVISYAVFCLK